MKTLTLGLLIYLFIAIFVNSAHCQVIEDEERRIIISRLHKMDYQTRCMLGKHEGNYFFIGKKKYADKYHDMPDCVLKYIFEKDEVVQLVDPTVLHEYFDGIIACEKGCYAVSPIGNIIALGRMYCRDEYVTNDIMLINTKNGNITKSVSDGMDNRNYFISPNEKHLLFYAHQPDSFKKANMGNPAKSFSVRLMNIGNQDVKVLKNIPSETTNIFRLEKAASWSPDSEKVVFEYYVPGTGMELQYYNIASSVFKTLDSHPYSYDVVRFVDEDRIIVAHSRSIMMFHCSTLHKDELVSNVSDVISNISIMGNNIRYQLGSSTKNMYVVRIPD